MPSRLHYKLPEGPVFDIFPLNKFHLHFLRPDNVIGVRPSDDDMIFNVTLETMQFNNSLEIMDYN